MSLPPKPPPEVLDYYALGEERGRLDQDLLERARTGDILDRHLPPPPGVVLDVGGAAGAHRVLKPGGWLFAAAISRFASLLDGLRGELFDQPLFVPIVEQDLATGRHRNDTGLAKFFTTAFFHHPDELKDEVTAAGFALEGVFAVEGPAALMPDFARRWADPAQRTTLLRFLRKIEREPALLGATFHLVAVARRP